MKFRKKLFSNFKEIFKKFWKNNFRNTSIKFFKYFGATLEKKKKKEIHTKVLKKLPRNIIILLRILKKNCENCEKFDEILEKF